MKKILRNLWLPLGIPLLVVGGGIAIAILFFHLAWSWDDFLINLLTEMIGIAFTVGYVDWILRRHRARQWEEARQGVLLRLQTFVISSTIKIRVSLGCPGFPEAGVLSSLDYSTEYPEFRKLIEELIDKQETGSLDIERWSPFIENLQDIREESETLVTLFGGKLEAPQYKSLLNIHLAASKTLLWCPVLVSSVEQSPEWWPVPAMLQDGITAELVGLLYALMELGDTLV